MVSTASFSTLDYTQWPQFTQWVLLMLMFVGACAGSTGGGLKVSRFIMLVKSAASDVRRMIHPRRVTRIQLDGSRVESGTLKAVYTYFLIYVLIIVAGTMVVSLDGCDMTTNFTAALALHIEYRPRNGADRPRELLQHLLGAGENGARGHHAPRKTGATSDTRILRADDVEKVTARRAVLQKGRKCEIIISVDKTVSALAN